MSTLSINGTMYREMICGGAAKLCENRKIVNDLNVFPIPDGDTGDNMFMTIDSGAISVKEIDSDDLEKASGVVASGMLRGARGNSGVILSRIFAGVSKGLVGIKEASIEVFGKALEKGITESYSAVRVPVEGTILTVYKDAVIYANSRINKDSSFESYFNDFSAEAKSSLEKTPDLLAVLKEAGVVDSGGAGLVYIVEGMKQAINGEVLDYNHEESQSKAVNLENFTEDSELTFGYCTEFLLRLQNKKVDVDNFDIEAFSNWLNGVGDSVVAFKDGSIIKVHVHTKKPGDILNYCQNFGEYLTLKIENMTLQHSEVDIKNNYNGDIIAKSSKPHKKYAIVTVAAGSGVKDTFIELGCDKVVDGGQSMNPSTEDFINAFKEINADNIFVFPNNGNIIMAANQAAEIYKNANIVVIPTKTIGEGYGSISMFDSSSDNLEEIKSSLIEAAESVTTGLVSKASRDTLKDGLEIKKDDYIGFCDGVIYTDKSNSFDCTMELCEKLNFGKHSLALVVIGKDATKESSDFLIAELQNKYSDTEVIPIYGYQPIYDYIIILE